MNPSDDPLNVGATLPRHDQENGRVDRSSPLHDLDAQHTIRIPGAGTLVFNRYRLQRVLGRGGMGVVWLAMDTKLERSVALKLLPDIVGADASALQDLKDETRRGLELAHPNIVRIYDLVNDDETAAISMEFVDGRNLSEGRLQKPHGVYTAEDIAAWIGQLCEALDYAHLQKRIVHRDLKPANLMLNTESALKITDFGIARSVSDAVSRLSRAAHQAGSGTLPYMSPQQIMGDRPQPTDDVYSLGATLYELFTGKPPFYSGDITLQSTTKKAPPLRVRRQELEIRATDDIPDVWEDAIASCLEKDPALRPQTAGELALRLGRGRPYEVQALPSGTISGTLKPMEVLLPAAAVPEREKKAPATAIVLGSLAALILLAGIGITAAWWWNHRSGSWAVQTEPKGAQVTVDGHTYAAPATLSSLKPGTHTASIALEGYEPRRVEFEVHPGQRADLGVVKLERSTGNLLLASDPDGVTYEVKSATDDKAQAYSGETPDTVTLPVGKYSVTMKHGGELKTNDVEIGRHSAVRQSFAFASAPLPSLPGPAALLPTAAQASPRPPADPAGRVALAPLPEPAAASSAGVLTPTATGPIASVPGYSASSLTADLVGAGLAPATPTPAPAPAAPSSSPVPIGPGAALPPSASLAPPPLSPGPTPDTPPQPPIAPTGGLATDTTPVTLGPQAASEGVPPTGNIAPQPAVQPPPAGYWKLNEIFANSEYRGYSEPGRRYLVHKAQQIMKQDADGVPGRGTHQAIQNFQTAHALQPTGQLDSTTLAAMGLTGEEDNSDWGGGGGGGGQRRTVRSDDDEDKTAARKFIEKKILGGRDLKSIFRR